MLIRKPIYQALPLLLVIASFFIGSKSFAQGDEQRYKIELSITAGGKTAKTFLNSSSVSFSRQDLYNATDSAQKNSVREQGTNTAPQLPRDIYLSADASSISREAMEILAKHKGILSGTVTVTDAYSQSEVKRIQFSNALLSGYSDQISSYGYNGKPGSVAFSFICKELTVDGVTISQ